VMDGRGLAFSTMPLLSLKAIDLAGRVSARFEDSPTIDLLFSNPLLCRGVGLVDAADLFPLCCDIEFRPWLDINESLEEVRLTPDGCGGARSSGPLYCDDLDGDREYSFIEEAGRGGGAINESGGKRLVFLLRGEGDGGTRDSVSIVRSESDGREEVCVSLESSSIPHVSLSVSTGDSEPSLKLCSAWTDSRRPT
jgi:hypothetical protein